jgi:hypothetical protein
MGTGSHYSNILKVINMKLRILGYFEKVQLLDKVHNSKAKIFGVMTLFEIVSILS